MANEIGSFVGGVVIWSRSRGNAARRIVVGGSTDRRGGGREARIATAAIHDRRSPARARTIGADFPRLGAATSISSRATSRRSGGARVRSFSRQRRSSRRTLVGRHVRQRVQSGSSAAWRDGVGSAPPLECARGPSASRRARSRRPTGPCAHPPAGRAPARGHVRGGAENDARRRVARAVIVGDCAGSSPAARAAPPASTSFARPKSSTFTVPSGRTLTLAGLRSR